MAPAGPRLTSRAPPHWKQVTSTSESHENNASPRSKCECPGDAPREHMHEYCTNRTTAARVLYSSTVPDARERPVAPVCPRTFSNEAKHTSFPRATQTHAVRAARMTRCCTHADTAHFYSLTNSPARVAIVGTWRCELIRGFHRTGGGTGVRTD